ncbi:MAG: hypothetical protein A2Z64_08475 [Betaproteobacteria bacterium RIFCSPLOWO2_02_67_12]|nr:MAG: hypothetical protein A2Z64_08475 [Betaproteobacteria bacterium RIFCSPLOWO2_02_67_12]
MICTSSNRTCACGTSGTKRVAGIGRTATPGASERTRATLSAMRSPEIDGSRAATNRIAPSGPSVVQRLAPSSVQPCADFLSVL